jgi:hypothetical protein
MTPAAEPKVTAALLLISGRVLTSPCCPALTLLGSVAFSQLSHPIPFHPSAAEPEVRQITLPPGGARLIIASDGLWDAVQPKTIIQKVRFRGVGLDERPGHMADIQLYGMHPLESIWYT